MRRSPDKPVQERGLLSELEALYREVDTAFARWSCPASTDCCRFGVTGREPYVTSIELAALERALAAGGRARRRAVPRRQRRALPLAMDERRCPLLSDEGRCTAYAARPLGCRTFFCDRADPGDPVRHTQIVVFVRRVQEIAARHRPGGEKGRPFTRALPELP